VEKMSRKFGRNMYTETRLHLAEKPLQGRDNLKDVAVDGKIILKMTS
jgi:hypothetical protein